LCPTISGTSRPVDRRHPPVQIAQRADQPLGRNIGERGRGRCEPQRRDDLGADVTGQRRGEERAGHALRDRPIDEAIGRRHDQ
jgi:hypothetical protein